MEIAFLLSESCCHGLDVEMGLETEELLGPWISGHQSLSGDNSGLQHIGQSIRAFPETSVTAASPLCSV